MQKRLTIYLRTHRRRWGLTQKELARLIGLQSGSQVSRLERGKRQPTFPIVIACVLIFGVQAADIFPALVNDVEDEVMQHAYQLYRALQGDTSTAAKAKLELLNQLVAHINPGQNKRTI